MPHPAMSLVSIVIPVYETRPWVRRAVESALAQRHEPIEVIVVDDGSTDGSIGEIRDLLVDGRVRLIRQPNRGVAAARNLGWRASRGDHLLFLDSDDEIAPDLIGALLGALEPGHPRQVAYCQTDRMDESGRQLPAQARSLGPARLHHEGNLLPALAFGGFFQIHSLLLRRALLEECGGFDERFRWCEDFQLHLRLFALGATARFLPLPLARYRIRPGNKSSNLARMRSWTAAAIADAVRRHPAAFAAALPECRLEFEWLLAKVRHDGEEHVARCAAYAGELERELRPGAVAAHDRLLRPTRQPGPPGPLTPRSRAEAPRVTEVDTASGPEEVAGIYLRMFLEATAESAALWRAARARLERCEGRARRLERALARRAARRTG